jgi:GlpG protein
LSEPNAARYLEAGKQARAMKELERERDAAAARKFINGRQILARHDPTRLGPLTLALIVICVGVWLIEIFGSGNPSLVKFVNALLISEYEFLRTLPEVRRGEIWRLFTPIFIHAPMFLHVLFNMLWLKDLGSMVEARQSSLRLALLVLVISGTSNVAQYFMRGPAFCGMSGVVYGLFGYIWMKSKFDPASGYYLDTTTVVMMLAWFFFCFSGLLPIANTVHAVGLGVGVVWGYLAALANRR